MNIQLINGEYGIYFDAPEKELRVDAFDMDDGEYNWKLESLSWADTMEDRAELTKIKFSLTDKDKYKLYNNIEIKDEDNIIYHQYKYNTIINPLRIEF